MRFENLGQKAGNTVISTCFESIEVAYALLDRILDAYEGLRDFFFGRPILQEPSTLAGLSANNPALRACCGIGTGALITAATPTHKY